MSLCVSVQVEKRIAPKLMEAMKTNTSIKALLIPNSNLHKQQGQELAEALKVEMQDSPHGTIEQKSAVECSDYSNKGSNVAYMKQKQNEILEKKSAFRQYIFLLMGDCFAYVCVFHPQ